MSELQESIDIIKCVFLAGIKAAKPKNLINQNLKIEGIQLN